MKFAHAAFFISALGLSACGGVQDPLGLTAAPNTQGSNDPNRSSAQSRSRQRAEAWFSKTDRSGVVGGQCAISCHSTIPFVLMNPMASMEDRITADAYLNIIAQRITAWSTLSPFYSWSPAASHSTEALLNVVSSVEYDRKVNKTLTETSCKALENLWPLQLTDGHFEWLNASLSPWEDSNAPYFAASLLTVSIARINTFLDKNNIQPNCAAWNNRAAHLSALQNYLKQNYGTTNKHGQAWFLWANVELNYQMAAQAEHRQKIAALVNLQRGDGGFDLNDFGPFTHERSGTPQSQPYITKIIIKALGNPVESEPQQALNKAQSFMNNFLSTSIDSLHSINDPSSETKNGFTRDANLAYLLGD